MVNDQRQGNLIKIKKKKTKEAQKEHRMKSHEQINKKIDFNDKYFVFINSFSHTKKK